jgi:hypothetical protein
MPGRIEAASVYDLERVGIARQECCCADCDPSVKFELLLNRNAAKSLHLEFPASPQLSPKR